MYTHDTHIVHHVYHTSTTGIHLTPQAEPIPETAPETVDFEEDFDAFSAVKGIDEKVSGSRKRELRDGGDEDADDDDEPTLATVVATMLDYITKHKATNVAAADIWGFLRTLLPPGNNLGTYYETVQKIVAAHLDNTLERCERTM